MTTITQDGQWLGFRYAKHPSAYTFSSQTWVIKLSFMWFLQTFAILSTLICRSSYCMVFESDNICFHGRLLSQNLQARDPPGMWDTCNYGLCTNASSLFVGWTWNMMQHGHKCTLTNSGAVLCIEVLWPHASKDNCLLIGWQRVGRSLSCEH